MLDFLSNERALRVGSTLFIADVHVGIELEVQRAGVSLHDYWKKLAAKTNELLIEASANELCVLGDLKHNVLGFYGKELAIVRDYIDALNCEKVTLTKGNHDGDIEKLEGRVNKEFVIAPATGIQRKIGKKTFGLFHGHAKPSHEVLKSDYLFLGHAHAGVQIEDFGHFWTEPCWIIAKTLKNDEIGSIAGKKAVLFPDFNPLSGVKAMNVEPQRRGPIINSDVLDIPNANVFLLSGMELGKLESLKTLAGVKTHKKKARQHSSTSGDTYGK